MRRMAIRGCVAGARSHRRRCLRNLAIWNPFPPDYRDWRVNVTSASTLAATLSRDGELARLFRRLATLRTDIALFDDVDQLRWKGPSPAFEELGPRLDAAISDASRTQNGRVSRNSV